MKYGVDVSFHKEFPDWSTAKNHVDFCIMGVTELRGKDASFEHNYKGCRENGIPIGAYKYSYAESWAGSKKEAQDIIDILAGRPVEMGIWLDLEWEQQELFPVSLLSDIIEGFREGIEDSGYTFAGIYCNYNWYRNFIPPYAKSRYRFWVAAYPFEQNDYGQVVEGLKPWDVENLIGWQYSQRGHVPGFGSHYVDMDLWYADIPGVEKLSEAPQETEKPAGPHEPIELSYGSMGEPVRILQKALNRFGSGLDEDGIFGIHTLNAVLAYQGENGLDADSIVGPKTWTKINNQLAALDVWQGLYGDGAERVEALRKAGYDPDAVQAEVNNME